MKRAKQRPAPALDLEREIDFAEVLLASRGMIDVQMLLAAVPWNAADNELDVYRASTGIIVAYCRPFTTSVRGKKRRIVGKGWTQAFSADEKILHEKALDMRHRDHAHTDAYEGR